MHLPNLCRHFPHNFCTCTTLPNPKSSRFNPSLTFIHLGSSTLERRRNETQLANSALDGDSVPKPPIACGASHQAAFKAFYVALPRCCVLHTVQTVYNRCYPQKHGYLRLLLSPVRINAHPGSVLKQSATTSGDTGF